MFTDEQNINHEDGLHNNMIHLKKTASHAEIWSQDERLSDSENMNAQRVKLLNDSQGNIYEGDLLDGKKHGEGKQIF